LVADCRTGRMREQGMRTEWSRRNSMHTFGIVLPGTPFELAPPGGQIALGGGRGRVGVLGGGGRKRLEVGGARLVGHHDGGQAERSSRTRPAGRRGGDESRDEREGEREREGGEGKIETRNRERRRMGVEESRKREEEDGERGRGREGERKKKGGGHGSSGGKGESGGSLDSPAIRGPRRALCWSTGQLAAVNWQLYFPLLSVRRFFAEQPGPAWYYSDLSFSRSLSLSSIPLPLLASIYNCTSQSRCIHGSARLVCGVSDHVPHVT
jgi:hypothetical protein